MQLSPTFPSTPSLSPQSTKLGGEHTRAVGLPTVSQVSPEPVPKSTWLNNALQIYQRFTCCLPSFRNPSRGSARVHQHTERKWSLVPEIKVSLEDILNMRHVSPIGLKDFEQYLLFEEYSAENLYFVLWMKDYTARYDAGAPALQLLHSVSRAKVTFFSPHSQYELNLPAPRVGEFLAVARDGNQSAYTDSVHSAHGGLSLSPSLLTLAPIPPHPSIFASIHKDVENMLRISASRFIRARSRNVSFRNLYCLLFGGFPALGLTLAPLLVSTLCHRGRWIRFAMIPPLWVGLTMVICLLNGVCVIIYLMARSRQLYPFELHQPPISPPLAYKVPLLVHQHSFATVETLRDIKPPVPCMIPVSPSAASFDSHGLLGHDSFDTHSHHGTKGGQTESFVLPEDVSPSPITEFKTSGFIPSRDSDRSGTHAPSDLESTWTYLGPSSGTAHMSPSAVRLAFDFDALPAKSLDSATGPDVLRAARGRGVEGLINSVFAPLARVESPVVSRAQRRVIMRAMAVAMFVTLVITGAFVAVPI